MQLQQIQLKKPSEKIQSPINFSKDKEYILGRGDDCTPKLVLSTDDEDFVEKRHCYIAFDLKYKAWFIEENVPTSYGTFVFCKNYDELTRIFKDCDTARYNGTLTNKEFRPSRKQLLMKGMQIYFSQHQFTVLEHS